ncbi:MAG: twin-arginine translocase subunit TatC [Phycisphaerales bacterium JB063]
MPLDQSHDHVDPYADRAGQDHPRVPAVEKTMPLGEHIEELRKHLIKSIVGTLICAIATFYFGFHIIAWLAQPLLQAQDILGFAPQFIQTDPTVGFSSVYLPVCLISAAIIASPWILWQIWQFVVTGLYEHEKRAVHILAPFSTIMTFLGVLFTYFVLLPVSLTFFLNFATMYPDIKLSNPNPVTDLVISPYLDKKDSRLSEDFDYDTKPIRLPVLEADPDPLEEGMLWMDAQHGLAKVVVDGDVRILNQRSTRLINPLPQLGQYVRFASIMMLGIVIAFQLPVVMLVMGWTQLFDPYALGKLRKYAFFGCFIAGAVLTPTDVFSMIVLAVPLYLLYEFGLLLMRWTYKSPTDGSDKKDSL